MIRVSAAVRCPQCGGEVTVRFSDEVLEAARRSPFGMTGLVVPHGDHALVVYLDSRGRVRNVRAFSIIPKTRLVEGERTLMLDYKSLEPLENIYGVRLHEEATGLTIMGFKHHAMFTMKVREGGLEFELGLLRYDGADNIARWLEVVGRELRDAFRDLNATSFLLMLYALDGSISDPPPPDADRVVRLILRSPSLKYRVDREYLDLVLSYAPRTPLARLLETIEGIVAGEGEYLLNVLRGCAAGDVVRVVTTLLTLEDRGVVEIYAG